MPKVDPELLAIGREVRRLRRQAGLSQEELAEQSGLHTNYIGGIERGERNVGIKALLCLARALDLHPSEMLAGIPNDGSGKTEPEG